MDPAFLMSFYVADKLLADLIKSSADGLGASQEPCGDLRPVGSSAGSLLCPGTRT